MHVEEVWKKQAITVLKLEELRSQSEPKADKEEPRKILGACERKRIKYLKT